MIQITVFQSDNQVTAFELTGHAESGPYGYDLVCAGVSAVTFGAVNAIMKLCETDLNIDQGADGGYLSVRLPKNISSEKLEKIQWLVQGMIVSLETIEESYGEHVRLNFS
ncbi:ribosomal-processing cysteine protease Prp [Oceanobacillus sojae]|uniref:ribosomal-processing cysteine protease Prp n=1 Tax=Oceanobacillus sojae TaxID=582851 RepID=UPI0009882F3C|nr:ribosomal-processing cysteine protease Prp [Oceanobacillus sojae]MCT1903364.1 ribosomal-processing cysteine protease Prp [Oceanobacillus sojae]